MTDDAEATRIDAARAQFGLAHGWLRRDRPDRAVHHFRAAIEIDPELEGAYLRLARLLYGDRRWRDTIDISEAGLRHFPNQAILHKLLIGALIEAEGHQAALDRHRLRRVDDRSADIDAGEVLGCVVVRNERARLPWFFEENRRLGVSTFLVVDNGSTDGTVEWLAGQPDVLLWQTDASFNEGNFGSAWFEVLLRRHGLGHWVVMLDADEILCFPGYENASVRELCTLLDRGGYRAMSGIMVDMYGRGSVADTRYVTGEDFLDHCRWFDRRTHHESIEAAGPFDNQTFHFGGARRRVFGTDVEYLVTKTPLVRYDSDVVLAGGQHFTSHPADRIAHDACAVLHFKYFASFIDYAESETERAEHSEGGRQYRSYVDAIRADDDLRLFDPDASVEYRDSHQLLELGIVDDGWRRGAPWPSPTGIEPVASETARPRWSVMISVYDRLHTIERAVRSVLDQDDGEMQIAVVADRHHPTTSESLAALVRSIDLADERVEIHALDTTRGHPGIFDECIRRARGEWVHILHDDDWVKPGFYAAVNRGIDARPELGAAFTRHEIPSTPGHSWSSWLERETPGVIDDWLDRIATECRVQFSAVTVRRAVYEELGGFLPGMGSAFDWEMWQRIAARHPVWFDPEVLAVIRRDGSAETDRLVTDGGQIADSLAAVEFSRRHLPPERADELARHARDRFALHGLDLARAQLRRGHHEHALRNITAALEASRTPDVIDVLRRLDDHHAADRAPDPHPMP